jgi:hypothetical protein
MVRRGERSVGLAIELGEEGAEIEGTRDHREFAVLLAWPFVGRSVAVDLDAVAVGIVQVDGLADAVVGGAVDCDAMIDETLQRAGQLLARRIEDGEVVETGRSSLRRRTAAALPGVQSEVVMIAAGGEAALSP